MSTNDEPTRFEAAKELDWLHVRVQMNQAYPNESSGQKLVRKMGENPAVPIGCTVTVAALGFGLWNFYSGRPKMSQYMMRLRVAAQGFTILAMVAGFIVAAQRDKK